MCLVAGSQQPHVLSCGHTGWSEQHGVYLRHYVNGVYYCKQCCPHERKPEVQARLFEVAREQPYE